MGWGSTGGGGVGTGAGSPEHARADRGPLSRGPGPPGDDPPRGNGCLFALALVVLVIALLIGAGYALRFLGGG